MTVEIREACEADLPAVLALYAQPEMDNGDVLPAERAQEIFARMLRYPHYRIYVTVAGDEVVGAFSLLVMDNLAHMGAKSGLIEDVVVSPGRQRMGIGTKMMEAAINLCKEKGCYKIALSSNSKREAAHAFYEALGFTRRGYSFVVDLT